MNKTNIYFIISDAYANDIEKNIFDELKKNKYIDSEIDINNILFININQENLNIASVINDDQYKNKIKVLYIFYTLFTKEHCSLLKTIHLNYEIKTILSTVSKYSNTIKNILNKYNLAKVNFYNNISNFKPSIYRTESNELVSINDFININKNKTISPKKIEIKFIDGKINISYKIIDYEQY